MTYDILLAQASRKGLIVKEKPLNAFDGLILRDRIAIRKGLGTTKKCCVLAEEIGHYETTSGNIITEDNMNAKQERRARGWAYDYLIGLRGLLKCGEYENLWEAAEALEVTECFLHSAIEYYKSKYAPSIVVDGVTIRFEPGFEIQREDPSDSGILPECN